MNANDRMRINIKSLLRAWATALFKKGGCPGLIRWKGGTVKKHRSVCNWCKNISWKDDLLNDKFCDIRKTLYVKHLFFGIHELEKIPVKVGKILDRLKNGDDLLFQYLSNGL